MYIQIEAAKLLVEKTDILFQKVWDKGEQISAEERNELEQAVFTAKVFTTQVGLDITSRIFEVMGSRATSSQYGYDRFWRNMRTMTLHGPVDTIIQDLGFQNLHQ